MSSHSTCHKACVEKKWSRFYQMKCVHCHSVYDKRLKVWMYVCKRINNEKSRTITRAHLTLSSAIAIFMFVSMFYVNVWFSMWYCVHSAKAFNRRFNFISLFFNKNVVIPFIFGTFPLTTCFFRRFLFICFNYIKLTENSNKNQQKKCCFRGKTRD